MTYRTKITCHRGAHLLAPENTFASFDAALALGGDVLEFDIRQSKDGVLYVIHDDTVDRTTNGTGSVADMTSAELDELDAGHWFGTAWTGTGLPKLDDFLTRYRGRCEFYLEVKYADCEAIAHMLRKHDCMEATYTCSFDPAMRADMLTYAPEVRQMLHCWDVDDVDAAKRHHNARIIEFQTSYLDPSKIQAVRDAGLELQIFCDSWDMGTFTQILRDWRFDYINIDHIAEASVLRRALQG